MHMSSQVKCKATRKKTRKKSGGVDGDMAMSSTMTLASDELSNDDDRAEKIKQQQQQQQKEENGRRKGKTRKISLLNGAHMSTSQQCDDMSDLIVPANASNLVLIKYKQSWSSSSAQSTADLCQQSPSSLPSSSSSRLQKRREVHYLLLFVLFLFIAIITLSQILVMHSRSATNSNNFKQIKLMQEELKLMDVSIDKMLKEKNVTPIRTWLALKQYKDNLAKFTGFMDAYGLNYSSQLDAGDLRRYDHRDHLSLTSIHDEIVNDVRRCGERARTSSAAPRVFGDKEKEEEEEEEREEKEDADDGDEDAAYIYTFLVDGLNESGAANDTKAMSFAIRSLQRYLDKYSKTVRSTIIAANPVNASSSSNNQKESNQAEEEEKEEDEKEENADSSSCLQTIIFSLYYILNKRYSILFETHSYVPENALNRTLHSLRMKTTNTSRLWASMDSLPLLMRQTSTAAIDSNNSKNPNNEESKHSADAERSSTRSTVPVQMKLCDAEPPLLYGALNVVERKYDTKMLKALERENGNVTVGGSWWPRDCQARHRIAIIIPYRDRQDHLVTLLSFLHPILQRQQLDYRIFVTEQAGNGTFNKAIIMNAAFIYAFDQANYNCYCFHDVDLVPENDKNMYSCGQYPKHMSVGVDEMNYKLQYEELIGGVLILRTEHLIAANGYSNLYWGWGAEDDDLYYRLKGLGLKVERPPLKIGRYKMMKHQKRKPQLWSKRAKLLYSSVNRMTWDGISSAQYKLLNVTMHKLYTHLLIDVGVPPAGFA